MWQSKCGFRSQVGESTAPIQREINEEFDIPLSENPLASTGDQQIEADTENTNVPDYDHPQQENQVPPPASSPPTAPSNVEPPSNYTTRSGRTVRPPSHLDDFVTYEHAIAFDNQHPHTYLKAFAASSDPDIMYLQEAMNQPDYKQFLKAMEDEVRAHTENGNWVLVDRKAVPRNQPILPSVWAMRRKRDIATQQVYKWKARLNVHGGKQVKGVKCQLLGDLCSSGILVIN
jgi:hypothetical protein